MYELFNDFFVNNWPSILLSLTTAGALAFCRWAWKQIKAYKQLLAEREHDSLDEAIEEKLAPILEDIEDLREYIRSVDTTENHKMNLIVASYRFRLIQLCKIYLKQRYITQDQYDQLTEFYKVYEGLGGNGQAKDYYEKAVRLEIKD